MLDGIFDKGLQGEAWQLQRGQMGRNIVLHRQSIAKAGQLDLQIGAAVFLLLLQGGKAALALEILAEKSRQMQQQIPRLARILAGDGADGVEGIEQKMGVDLGLDQFEFGLHQQPLLLLQPTGQQLL